MNGFTGPFEDRLALRELAETYIDAVHQRDADRWSACWTEDGCWEVGGRTIEGREPIRRHWTTLMDDFAFVFMQSTPGAMIIEGDSAEGRAFVVERLHKKDGGKLLVFGRYDDAFSKDAGGWRFRARRYTVLQLEA